MPDIGAETLRRHRAQTGRSEPSARIVPRRTLPLSLVLLAFGLLFPSAPRGAEPNLRIYIAEGESFPLTELDPIATSQVTYSDGRHPFLLQCPARGTCYLLGAEAGQGKVRGMSRAGTDITYEVTVSAVAHAGNPLAAGVAPRALGDPNGLALPTQAAPLAQKYAHNPVVKELEVPRVATIRGEYPSPGTLGLMAGSSRLIDFAVPLRRVAIADSAVADVEVIGPTQVMVVGHQPGFTTLITWDDYGNYREQVVRVDQGGPQEIQLNIVVAELNRTRLEEQGIDVSASFANTGVSVVGVPGGVAGSYSPSINLAASGGAGTVVALPPQGVLPNAGSLIPLLLSSTLTYGLATQNGQVATNTFLQLLERHDLAKILAEPRLIAESGQEAKFLSGGEIPIVIAQALNTSIVFKQFGTSVNFVPTVIDSSQGEIELQVRPEFSQPDYSQGVQLFGFTVPAFVTRRAETKVRLHENQTLIIAGLILNTDTSQLRKVPYLGDMPYLGAFFRHTYWNHVRSELLMTVTPQLIQPIPANAQVALPIERAPMTREEVRTRELSQPDITRPRLR